MFKIPKCGRRSPRRGRSSWCSVSRCRAPGGGYAPACAAHLTREERAELGMLPGMVPQPRRRPDVLVDVAKLRAGDRD